MSSFRRSLSLVPSIAKLIWTLWTFSLLRFFLSRGLRYILYQIVTVSVLNTNGDKPMLINTCGDHRLIEAFKFWRESLRIEMRTLIMKEVAVQNWVPRASQFLFGFSYTCKHGTQMLLIRVTLERQQSPEFSSLGKWKWETGPKGLDVSGVNEWNVCLL